MVVQLELIVISLAQVFKTKTNIKNRRNIMFKVGYFMGTADSGRMCAKTVSDLMGVHLLDDSMHYPESYIVSITNLATGEVFDDLNDIYEMGGK